MTEGSVCDAPFEGALAPDRTTTCSHFASRGSLGNAIGRNRTLTTLQTRVPLALLGPCFKTGHGVPTRRQQPRHGNVDVAPTELPTEKDTPNAKRFESTRNPVANLARDLSNRERPNPLPLRRTGPYLTTSSETTQSPHLEIATTPARKAIGPFAGSIASHKDHLPHRPFSAKGSSHAGGHRRDATVHGRRSGAPALRRDTATTDR